MELYDFSYVGSEKPENLTTNIKYIKTQLQDIKLTLKHQNYDETVQLTVQQVQQPVYCMPISLFTVDYMYLHL